MELGTARISLSGTHHCKEIDLCISEQYASLSSMHYLALPIAMALVIVLCIRVPWAPLQCFQRQTKPSENDKTVFAAVTTLDYLASPVHNAQIEQFDGAVYKIQPYMIPSHRICLRINRV